MIKNKKRVMLTGIGGSIGCHFFAHIMQNTDWHVVGVDSFRHKGWTDRIVNILDDHPEWRERLTLITHDLMAPFSPITKGKMGHIDYIISMASLSDVWDSIREPITYVTTNVAIVLNLLEYAREIKPEVFLQISTDEVYGPTENKKQKGAKEWAPIAPSNPYSASKACQEAIAIAYWRTYGVPLIITNTMNNFGEMQQHNKFPVLVQKKIAKGEVVTIHGKKGAIGSRSYIHSRNFADAVLFLLKKTKPHQHVPGTADLPDRYNIAGDKQLDNVELAKLIAKLMKKKLIYKLEPGQIQRPGHDPHYALDDKKLYSLGWKPPHSFEESMENTIKWQMNHPEWIDAE
jgi:dTDP-glucose 4,6-dehydratase